MRTLLIDGDIIAFQAAAKCEDRIEDFTEEVIVHQKFPVEQCYKFMDEFLQSLLQRLKATQMIVCLSDLRNFRYDVLPTYKGNRDSSMKPHYLELAKDYLLETYDCHILLNAEADDAMGVLATDPSYLTWGEKIICTTDKDLYQIPVKIYNWHQDRLSTVTPEEGLMYHMSQVLSGDVADGYGGVTGLGEKKAFIALLEGLEDGLTLWEAVLRESHRWGMDVEDALCIARVAKICQYEDVDKYTGEIKLWEPPTA